MHSCGQVWTPLLDEPGTECRPSLPNPTESSNNEFETACDARGFYGKNQETSTLNVHPLIGGIYGHPDRQTGLSAESR